MSVAQALAPISSPILLSSPSFQLYDTSKNALHSRTPGRAVACVFCAEETKDVGQDLGITDFAPHRVSADGVSIVVRCPHDVPLGLEEKRKGWFRVASRNTVLSYASLVVSLVSGAVLFHAALVSSSFSVFAAGTASILDVIQYFVLKKTPSNFNDSGTKVTFGANWTSIKRLGNSLISICAYLALFLEALISLSKNSRGTSLTMAPFPSTVASLVVALQLAMYISYTTFGAQTKESQARTKHHASVLLLTVFCFAVAAFGNISYDRLGAALLSSAVIYRSSPPLIHQASIISAKSAPPSLVQRITKQLLAYDQDVEDVKCIKVFSTGTRYFVEATIIMSGTIPLWKARGIANGLQAQLEASPEIARAFVKIDYDHSLLDVSQQKPARLS